MIRKASLYRHDCRPVHTIVHSLGAWTTLLLGYWNARFIGKYRFIWLVLLGSRYPIWKACKHASVSWRKNPTRSAIIFNPILRKKCRAEAPSGVRSKGGHELTNMPSVFYVTSPDKRLDCVLQTQAAFLA